MKFIECCDDPDITDQCGSDEPKFFCTNCDADHCTPIKETPEYLELKEAYCKLWRDTENGLIKEYFFKHRERFRKIIQGLG